jgi:DNA-nicking Smr family endonuclease
VEDAQNAFENFIKDSIATGKRAVLIVHGRGLSSPDRPVLKTKVVEWLTRGPFRKWVIAFSSARSFDGGAGATYVLLRQRPLTRRYRKKVKHHCKS